MPPITSRRTLLRLAGLGLGTVAVSACSGERRRTPWSPTPDAGDPLGPPPPDLELLLSARVRIARYRELLARTEPDGTGQRATLRLSESLWPVQQERIEAVIRLSGADLPALTGAVPQDSASTSEPAASTSTALTLLELGRAVREEIPTALAEVARATPANRAVLASLAAEHAVSAQRCGAPIRWPELVGPTGTAAVPLLAATRPAAFGLEVVAARSTGEERERYEAILDAVRVITRSLTTLAGDAAPVPPLGYDLPEEVRTAGQRRGLARDLVADIAPAALSVVDRAGSAVEQVESLVRIVVEATVWARRLDVDDVPFPGMTLP